MTNENKDKHGEACVLTNAQEIYNKIVECNDAFLFDMDGVLWKVNEPFSAARDVLDMLRDQNKLIFFVTNNSLLRADTYKDKIERLGLGTFEPEQVFCSANAVALLLKQKKFRGKVLLIGPQSLKEEISALDGVELVDIGNVPNIGPYTMASYEIDKTIDGVVIGFDQEFNYFKAAYATALLCAKPDALFVATNDDLRFPTQHNILPGTGAFVRCVEAGVGRRAIVAGKPNDVIIKEILNRHPILKVDRMCMIGDNLCTDIAFGKQHGLNTVLVETGVHTREDLKKVEYADLQPDFILGGVKDLLANKKKKLS